MWRNGIQRTAPGAGNGPGFLLGDEVRTQAGFTRLAHLWLPISGKPEIGAPGMAAGLLHEGRRSAAFSLEKFERSVT